MDDVIKRLVEVDKECAKKVEEAKSKKLDAQSNMSSKRSEIYDEYIASKSSQIQEHKDALVNKNKDEVSQQEQQYQESLKTMEKLFKENEDKWVSEIVDRSLK